MTIMINDDDNNDKMMETIMIKDYDNNDKR